MLLLKATERNWGRIAPGDWDKHSWKIYEDGWYQYKETYRSNRPDELPEIPDVVAEGVLTASQMERLKAALQEEWSMASTDACDGTAWEFKLYDGSAVVRHRELGAISGIEPYERIVDVLRESGASDKEEAK